MGLGIVIGVITILVVGYFVYASLRLKNNYEHGKAEKKPGEEE